jgi:hypothetical protein
MKTFLTTKFSYFLISAWCSEQRLYCPVPVHAARSATTNRKRRISHVLKVDGKSKKIEEKIELDRQTEEKTDGQTETHVKGQTANRGTAIDRQTETHIKGQADRQTDRQTGKQKQTHKRTDRKTCSHKKDGQGLRQIDKFSLSFHSKAKIFFQI